MPIVGCLVPTCAQLHVYDTDTGSFDVYGDDNSSSPHKPKDVRHIIKTLLNTLQVTFDVLVIVHPGHRDVDVNEFYTMAHGYSMDVYIIPSLMARFMAVFERLHLTLHNCWVFAMITHAVGADCHVIRSFARDKNGFKVVQDTCNQPGNIFNPAAFTSKPERTAYVTFEHGHSGVPAHMEYPAPLPEGYPFDHVHFHDFTSMLFEGGLAKARQIAGHGNYPLMADFVDTISANINGETYHVFKVGEPIPAETKFRKVLSRKSNIQIKTGLMLISDGILKRVSMPLYYRSNGPGLIQINVSVDCYGLLTFMEVNSEESASNKASLAQGSAPPVPLLSLKVKTPPKLMASASNASMASSVDTKEPWRYKNVVGYELMSTKFILHATDGTPTEESVDGVPEIIPGTTLTTDLIREHCEAVFSRLPKSATNANVLVIGHDGNCSSTFVGIAVDVAKFHLSMDVKVYVICDTIAYSRVALRHLRWSPSDGSDTVFLAIMSGADCRYTTLERNKEDSWGWRIVESVKISFGTTGELSNLFSTALDRHSTTTNRLLLTDRAPLSLQQQMGKLSIRILRIKNFHEALVEGILDFADSVADSDVPGYRRQRDVTSPVYCKQSFGAMQELTSDGQVKFSQNVLVDPALGGFKIFQRISTFSAQEYVLFEASDIPPDYTSINVTITNEPFSIPRVKLVPPLTNANPSFTFSPHVATEIPMGPTISHASSVTSLPTAVPEEKPKKLIRTIINPEQVELNRFKYLKSNNVQVNVKLHTASCTVEIEFIRQNGFEVITDLNGHRSIPFVVSFAQEQPRCGIAAIVDFKKHPNRVVWDLLHILGRTVNDVVIDPKWTFDIIPATRFDDTAMIEFNMPQGRVITAPSWITAIFLRAIQTLVFDKTGVRPRRFHFQVSPGSTSRMQAMVREACKLAGIVFSGSNTLKSS